MKCKKKWTQNYILQRRRFGLIDPRFQTACGFVRLSNPTYLPYHFFVHSTIYIFVHSTIYVWCIPLYTSSCIPLYTSPISSPLGFFSPRYLAAKINMTSICHQSLMARRVISHHRSANVPLAILALPHQARPLSLSLGERRQIAGCLGDWVAGPDSRTRHFAAALMLVLPNSVRLEKSDLRNYFVRLFFNRIILLHAYERPSETFQTASGMPCFRRCADVE